MSRRLAALASLLLALTAIALLTACAVVRFPRGTAGLALIALALAAGWYGLTRRGLAHVAGLVAGPFLIGLVLVLLIADVPGLIIPAIVALAMSVAAATYAFRARTVLPAAPRARHPVVIWNPRSGDGKAARARLADAARARGIEPVELTPGADLAEVATRALDSGADAIAMAGGDGSQAIVARLAADRGVPFACIPAGTRNHFARDLGVDRDDVVGALDALVDGGERCIDLGDVNGRTFVNNVSIGLYGEAVQRTQYRGAKLRTLLETVPEVLGPQAATGVRWRDSRGAVHAGAAAVVVSNNRYRLGHGIGDGTRPRLDESALGITVLARPGDEPGMRMWSAPTFAVDSDGPVHAGIDGEAVVLQPPLQFRIRHHALNCRIARSHPGASPSAQAPTGPVDAIRRLFAIASGMPAADAPVRIDKEKAMAKELISGIEEGAHRAAWGIALRGLAAVIFGAIAVKYPSAAAGSFVVVFAVFAFADALLEIVAATSLGRSGMRWGWYAFSALVNIAAGVVALTYPQVTFTVILLLVAARAILIGGLEIALAVSWRDLEPRWLLGLGGLLSIVFGGLLFANPARAGLALMWTIGVYAIAFGVVMIVLGARLAMGERHHALPGGHAAAA